MKEHPILFSTVMVNAILEDRKTQTRRVVKPQPTPISFAWQWVKSKVRLQWGEKANADVLLPHCPYGQHGAHLWVRETWMPTPATASDRASRPYWYRAGVFGDEPKGLKWRPSIFMPRAASRITLEIASVRVERLQEISEEDAKAEGIFEFASLGFYGYDKNGTPGKHCFDTARETYAALWDKINGKRKGCAWKDNPWLWKIEFKRIKP